MAIDVRRLTNYLDTLELPVAYESFDDDPEAALGPSFVEAPQAIAVGAQLTEFSAAVSPEIRAAVSDSLLLAQLAANKSASKPDAPIEVFAWYDKYIEVLKGIGWRVVDFEQQTQEVSTHNSGVHSAIIPVVTAMLGPAVAAGSMVVSILQGLQEMDASSKWITVFDRASRHARGAKFQVGHVDVGEDGDPVIKVACFSIDAGRDVTQVLFFRFSTSSAQLRKAAGTFATGRARLLDAQVPIAERVKPFIAEFVRNVEI